jgi:hypothetical protein
MSHGFATMNDDLLICHTERSEGSMQLACSAATPASYIDPSRKSRAQDDKQRFVGQIG